MTDSDSAEPSGNGRKPKAQESAIYAVARPLLFGAIAVGLMLWVAFYNGYPTVYPDTGSYLLTSAFHVAFPPYRSPVYSRFIGLTGLGASAWYTVAAQAIIVVVALWEACKFLIGGSSRFRDYSFLAIACALAALTSLPWEASQLMPDVFAGTAFLAMFLLAFNGRLRTIERVVLLLILTISVGAHTSLLPITAAFAAAILLATVVAVLAGWRMPAPPAKVVLASLLAPILAAGLWTASLNRGLGLGFAVSPSSNEYLLANLFGTGLAGDYLRETCSEQEHEQEQEREQPFAACRHLDNLPRTPEQFMFWSPILHEMDGDGNEMRALVRGTLTAHPFRFVAYSTKDTLLQFVENRTGDEIRAWDLGAPNGNGEDIFQVFPGDARAFANGKQSHSGMSRFTNILSVVHIVVFWFSVLGCVYFARANFVGGGLAGSGPAGATLANEFFYSAIVFLSINAAVCATFAGVYERYQARVAWIIPLSLAFYACQLLNERSERMRAISV